MRKEAKIKDSIKGFHWWLGALLLLLSACVTDYEPKGLEQVRDLLVVDGIITNGETTIKLRRSVGLTDDFTEDEFVNNAKVVVEREDGAVFTCANSSGKGEYKVDMGQTKVRASVFMQVSSNVLNMILSVLFVFVLHFDIEGVAWATLLSQLYGAAAGCWLMYLYGNFDYKNFDYKTVFIEP